VERKGGSGPGAAGGVRFAFAAVLIALPLALSAQSSSLRLSDGELRGRGFVSAAKSSALELYVNDSTGFLALRTAADGRVRFSSPLDWESDDIASGFVKNAIPSLVSIRAKDRNSQQYPANSYVNVVRRSGLVVERIDGGLRMIHDFEREGIEIPVEVRLDGDSLVFSVPLDQIKEDDDELSLKLLNFTIAPYFGAAPRSENGYIFVPDGSGAVIRFNNRNTSTVYQQYVYGRDTSIVPVMKKNVTETIHLPVFGLSAPDSGFFAVIEEGAARAWINAETAYQRTGYNAVSASCTLRDFDTVSFRERTGTPREVPIFEQGNFKGERFTIRYMFLGRGENNYVGMADVYRRYLQERGRFTTARERSKPALVLDFIGAGPKVKPVLGIPSEVTVAYTPFDSARSIIERLRKYSVDSFVVKYEGWTRGGMMDSYPGTARAEPVLGGDADLRRLGEYLETQGAPLFLGVDFVNLYKPDISHMRELATNRALNRAPAKNLQYRLTTFDAWADSRVSWYLRASAVAAGVARFKASLDKKLSAGIAPDTLGNLLGSDFAAKGTSRVKTASTFDSLLEALDDTGLMLSRPFDYALKYADFVSDLPTISSRFDIEDEAVPFYQILLKGYLSFSNLPGNRDVDRERYLLGLIETGAFPSYVLAAQNSAEMRDTRLEAFVNVNAEDWIEEAAEVFRGAAPVLHETAGKRILRHEILGGGLRRTVFEGGFEVLVNYSDTSARSPDGRTVAPLSYIAGYPAGKGGPR
jgi:hypothetical protein